MRYEANGLWIEFPVSSHDVKDVGRSSEKTSEKTSEKILRMVRANPDVTIGELAAKIGVTTRSVERNIGKLQTAGLLRRVGPAKGGYWEVQEADNEQ